MPQAERILEVLEYYGSDNIEGVIARTNLRPRVEVPCTTSGICPEVGDSFVINPGGAVQIARPVR